VFTERGRREYIALENLTFEIGENQIYCLLGPSGCGKSTALNLLAGFEMPSSGLVCHMGQEVMGPGPDRGVIFQGDDSLYPWRTARENIEFGLQMKAVESKERAKVAEEYLALVGLRGQGHKYPRELSGGMRQRIQIARVLAIQPRTLLLDEPFAALDAQTRKIMQEELVRIWQIEARNVLFITHDIIEALVLADRIGVMCAGPGANIREEISIDLPRPRDRTDPRLMALYRQVERLVEEEVSAARRAVEASS
jgi:NitT/TauT family transport system ATP-binding protein